MKIKMGIVLFWMSTALLLAQPPNSGQNENQLRDLANSAKSKGDLQQEATYLCQAASLDAKKYTKKCERAKQDAAKALAQFEADLKTGRFEAEHKDYPGALRDLGKITFGPDRQAAQDLIAQVHAASGSAAPDQASSAALQAAQAAYARSDLDEVEAQAKKIVSPALQPAAHQLLTNVSIYRDTMAQADALAQHHDFQGAEQKYRFAAMIMKNGPGHPGDRVLAMQAAEAQSAQSKTQAKSQPQPETPAPQQTPAPKQKVNYAAKVQDALADAKRHEANGELKDALHAFNTALQLDGRQSEALAGKQRVLKEMQEDPKELEGTLTEGITDYYASQFTQANEALGVYLQAKGGHHEGVAHFYLGASLLSQVFLLDPKDAAHRNDLRQQAQQQFALARQSKYQPIKLAVSPKILEQWTQTNKQP